MNLGFVGIAGFCAVCQVDIPCNLVASAFEAGCYVNAECHGSRRQTFIPDYALDLARTRGGEFLPETFLVWLRTLFADEADTEIRLLIAYNRGRTLQERVGCACGCSAHP